MWGCHNQIPTLHTPNTRVNIRRHAWNFVEVWILYLHQQNLKCCFCPEKGTHFYSSPAIWRALYLTSFPKLAKGFFSNVSHSGALLFLIPKRQTIWLKNKKKKKLVWSLGLTVRTLILNTKSKGLKCCFLKNIYSTLLRLTATFDMLVGNECLPQVFSCSNERQIYEEYHIEGIQRKLAAFEWLRQRERGKK